MADSSARRREGPLSSGKKEGSEAPMWTVAKLGTRWGPRLSPPALRVSQIPVFLTPLSQAQKSQKDVEKFEVLVI